MKKMILVLLAISAALISCKKETPVPVTQPVKFLSFTVNSMWNYSITNNLIGIAQDYTVTSTNRDSTINGKPYHVFTATNGGSNQYYYLTGNNYYTFYNLAASIISNPIESIYLKDNAAVNTIWSQSYAITISGLPLTITIANTVTEKGISKTVNGNVYNDVIHIISALSVSLLGIPLPAGAVTSDIQSYYAPKYGMIQSKNKISINYNGIVSNTDDETVLKSADIK